MPGIKNDHGTLLPLEPIKEWHLVPESKAQPFPEYVPQQIRSDYEEACLIVKASPKASATLARRCLQGMVRDFWAIKKGRLVDEIDELANKVDAETWDAIDSLRKIGNIGAHMEKDVNVIIDVEPDEAEKLIWLIELLVEDWYVRREERKRRLAEVKDMGAQKVIAKKASAPEVK